MCRVVNVCFPPQERCCSWPVNDNIADVRSHVHLAGMKNIQIIDGAANATFSIFQASDEEFEAMFPNGSEMEIIEVVIARLGEEMAGQTIAPMWQRPVLKRDAEGIHGTLFYDGEHRREYLPLSRREVDWPAGSINPAQKEHFAIRR